MRTDLRPLTQVVRRERAKAIGPIGCKDQLLLAYIDGDLDLDNYKLIERIIAADPETQSRVAHMRLITEMLVMAYADDEVTEPDQADHVTYAGRE
jgi:hypothetical protein